ncbi:MAG: amidophosphoribosyltransferase, partial [Chloroflexi bacterium]|nr:amidophosphoribosyltransferase [Chloroflexota bacterium]
MMETCMVNPADRSGWLANEHPQEECGVLGIYAPREDVARMAFFGLYALQHRGQEAAGIAVADGREIRMHKDSGLVSQVFSPARISALTGDFAIGHVRYSTTGSSSLRNAQPYLIDTQYGQIAVAHNGNLVNASKLRSSMLRNGVGFSSSSDSEVLTMMLAGASGSDWFE